MFSQAEENYLKALFHLTSEREEKTEAGTNELAAYLKVRPATVNNMLKKLKEKKLVSYVKYGKISLTHSGKKFAVDVIRKHRLWETFLHEKLEFSWDEVHEVAEQLEHIKSKKLIEKLEHFLGYPEVDPHGDPIPSAAGQIKFVKRIRLSEMPAGKICKLISVKDNSAPLLQKALEMGLELNSMIKIVARHELTDSIDLEVNNKRLRINRDFAENMYVV